MEDRLPLVQEVAHRRDHRAAKHGAARALASTAGKEPTAQCGDSRFSVGQDERGWWRSTGLRRRQEGSRAQATPARRYGRVGPQSQGPQCQGARPGRDQATSEGRTPTPSAPLSPVGGRRSPGQWQGMGRVGARAECQGRASPKEANIREDRKNLGTGMGKGGSRDRLAETAPTSGLRGFAETLGRGTYLLVVEPEQVDE